jgi:ribonuclease HepT-like protein
LARSLRDDLTHADKHAADLAPWSARTPVGYECHAAAILLHHLYEAIESFVERSLKTFDGTVPGGADSHIRLLEEGAREVTGMRPAILHRGEPVDELRRFRHRFRKRYDDDLDPELLHDTARSVLAAWPTIRAELASFADFVDKCLGELDSPTAQ